MALPKNNLEQKSLNSITLFTPFDIHFLPKIENLAARGVDTPPGAE